MKKAGRPSINGHQWEAIEGKTIIQAARCRLCKVVRRYSDYSLPDGTTRKSHSPPCIEYPIDAGIEPIQKSINRLTMAYKLETDVPMPDTVQSGGKLPYRTYPFPDMKPGMTFFAEGKTAPQIATAISTWVNSLKLGTTKESNDRKAEFKFAEVEERGKSGTRVWFSPEKKSQ